MSKNIFDLTSRPKMAKPKNFINKSHQNMKNLTFGGAKKEATIKKNKPPQSTQYSESDIKKLLEGYIEVPRDQWPTVLQKNDHIRYQRADNNLFRRGGFIFSQLINAQTQKKMIQLISNPFIPISATNRLWTISYDDIKTIWKKQRISPVLNQSASTPSSNRDNTNHNENEDEDENEDENSETEEKHGGEEKQAPSQTQPNSQNILPIQNPQQIIPPSIYTQIENIKIELMRLSNEQKNIINLIKRLHNIK